MKAQIISKVIELIFTILTTVVVSILLPAVTAWLKSKTNNEKIQAVIADISAAVVTCVDYAEQTIVPVLKEKDEWNSDTQVEVLDTVTSNVMDTLLETTKQIIEKNGINLEEIVAQKIEAYILSKKTSASKE
jgi:hypothetical protein